MTRVSNCRAVEGRVGFGQDRKRLGESAQALVLKNLEQGCPVCSSHRHEITMDLIRPPEKRGRSVGSMPTKCGDS